MKKLLLLAFVSLFVLSVSFAAAETKNTNCTNLTTDLVVGSTDIKTQGQVTRLQAFLQTKGYINIDPTGYFGPLTGAAVASYQAASGISPASGFVGVLTRSHINAASCQGSADTSKKITVTTPNGGESLKVNSSVEIKWNSTLSNNEKIDISLLFGGKDSGEVIARNVRNTGSYTWKVTPATSASASQSNSYKILISCASRECSDTSVFDQSDAVFSIVPQDIVKPSIDVALLGNKTFKAGDSIDLRWIANGVSADKVVMIALVNKNKDGLFVDVPTEGYCNGVGGCVAASTGKFTYNIPSSIAPGQYKLRVTCWTKNSEGSNCDASDETSYFKIEALNKGYVFNKDLSVGSKGKDVLALKTFLRSLGYAGSWDSTIDGSRLMSSDSFWNADKTSLASYQSSVGISPANGVFGPATRAYVNAVLSGSTVSSVPGTKDLSLSYIQAKAADKNEVYADEQITAYGKGFDGGNTKIYIEVNGIKKYFEVVGGVGDDILNFKTFASNVIPDGKYKVFVTSNGETSKGLEVKYVNQNSTPPAPPQTIEKYVRVAVPATSVMKNSQKTVTFSWVTNIKEGEVNVQLIKTDNQAVYFISRNGPNDLRGSFTGESLRDLPVGSYKVRVIINGADGEKATGTSDSVIQVLPGAASAAVSDKTENLPLPTPTGATQSPTTPVAKYVKVAFASTALAKGSGKTVALSWATNVKGGTVNLQLVNISTGDVQVIRNGIANDLKAVFGGDDVKGIPVGHYQVRIVIKLDSGEKLVGTSDGVIEILPVKVSSIEQAAAQNYASVIEAVIQLFKNR